MYCYANRENLVLLLDAMTPVLTQITTALKVLIIVWRRDEMRAILDYLQQSFYFGKFYNLKDAYLDKCLIFHFQIKLKEVSRYTTKRQ